MSDSQIIIPQQFISLINEKEKLKQEYREAVQLSNQLKALATKMPTDVAPEVLSTPLTGERTPIAELNAVLRELPAQQEHIQQLEAQLHQVAAQIAQSNRPVATPASNSDGWVIGLTVAVIVIALLLVILFSSHVL